MVQRGAKFCCKKCGILVNRESPVEEDRVTLHVPLSVQQAFAPDYPDQEQQVATSVSSTAQTDPFQIPDRENNVGVGWQSKTSHVVNRIHLR